jgi:predicted CXXCH cytochrome family protein
MGQQSSFLILRAILFAALIWICSGQAVQAEGIRGSAHDFSSRAWSGGQVCIVCHAPHATNVAVNAPLWNRSLSTLTYISYSSTTLNATVGQPDGTSKLCLGCHDGTIAMDSFGGYTGGARKMSDSFGSDLRDHHPISFVFDSTLAAANTRLRDPATALTLLGGTIAKDLLSGGKVQCTSCHDAHDQYGNSKLFKITDDGDALCLACHNL